MMVFWIVCSIAFIVMLILTIKKKRKRQKYKMFAVITSIIFIIGLFTLIGISSSPAIDENDNSSESTSSQKESSDLDNKVESVILDVRLDADKDISNLAEDNNISKTEAKKLTTKVGEKSEKVKKEIKKDKKYKKLEKDYEEGNISDSELSNFLDPYLDEINNIVINNLSN